MKSKRAAGPTMAADRLFGGCAFYIAPRRVRCLCIGPAVAALLVAASLGAARAVDMPDSCDYEEPTPGTKAKPFDINVSAEFDTDYIYRGITLSSHQPAVGVTIEVDRGPFYFTFEPHSVKLPTNPSAELGFTGGWCKKVADKIKIDLGALYYYYAGEVPVGPVTSTSYGEAHASIEYEPIPLLTLSAMYAYSPNYSNTGAWEHYVEGGLEIQMQKIFPNLLPKSVEWSITGTVSRSWVGMESASLGGLPLPSYTNWAPGLSFEFDSFTLALTYSNTSLTKEDCFVSPVIPARRPAARSIRSPIRSVCAPTGAAACSSAR